MKPKNPAKKHLDPYQKLGVTTELYLQLRGAIFDLTDKGSDYLEFLTIENNHKSSCPEIVESINTVLTNDAPSATWMARRRLMKETHRTNDAQGIEIGRQSMREYWASDRYKVLTS
jgi:hypothetical protein